MVGQGVGLIHDIPTVKEIIDGIVSGARVIMQGEGAVSFTGC